jgi:hypothetical protein
MKKEKLRTQSRNQDENKPYQVRIPGFISEEEIGLGDVIKRGLSSFRVRPCGGCGRRADVLNAWMTFLPKRTKQ